MCRLVDESVPGKTLALNKQDEVLSKMMLA